ncbi:hypothetical protein [Cribrihabitans marinus]|uniref:hypothetical protein n=1 Tax=Cribrihabitans marinus TaxID=1227549 RepID=UPI000B8A14B7|nr:hypothetical protein [Cribrihabitans marinus]GGH18135.1 hypothetical protein GCM10010973_00770 [Cribrihabitans marinus]
MKKLVVVLGLLVPIAACAQKPEAVSAAYVSPSTYHGWSCSQLNAEGRRLDAAYTRAAEQQNKARANDTAGVIFLGLPVSTLSGGNVADQIANLKGHQQVIHQSQIRKNCLSA